MCDRSLFFDALICAICCSCILQYIVATTDNILYTCIPILIHFDDLQTFSFVLALIAECYLWIVSVGGSA